MDWLAGGIDHGGHYCRAIWQKPKVHATALSEIPLTRDCILSYTNLLQILGKIYSKFHLPLSLYYFLRVIGILLSNNFQKMYQRVLDKICISIKNILDNYILINVINTYTFFFRFPLSFSILFLRVQRAGGSSPLGDVVAEADRVRVLKDGRHNTRESWVEPRHREFSTAPRYIGQP